MWLAYHHHGANERPVWGCGTRSQHEGNCVGIKLVDIYALTIVTNKSLEMTRAWSLFAVRSLLICSEGS